MLQRVARRDTIQYGFEAQHGERRVPFRGGLVEIAAGICVKNFQADC
jgi:hypothetical protein